MPRSAAAPSAATTRLFRALDRERRGMVALQGDLTAAAAVGPANDGPGEAAKARVLRAWLREHGFPAPRDYAARDPRVDGGRRPNLVVTLPGASPQALWIVTHLDVVPVGERSLWRSDPFRVVQRGGRLYGRGVEDNQQGMVASLFAAKALLEAERTPRHTVRLAFVSDEETGSAYGVKHLLARHRSLFREGDRMLVPDGGTPRGDGIEVAEKGMLWLRFAVTGRQCHASMPYLGRNAMRAGSDLVVRLGALHRRFPARDRLFEPPASTFEPTKRDANVPNVNTLPGFDAFHLDSRVLPRYGLDRVLREARRHARAVERAHGVRVRIETVHREDPAPPTSPRAPVVRDLAAAIRTVYGVRARPYGMGGGTVAALFRRAGLPAAVWSRQDEAAHAPNEHCTLANLLGDAKVYGALMAPQA